MIAQQAFDAAQEHVNHIDVISVESHTSCESCPISWPRSLGDELKTDGELLQRACERINDLGVPAFIKDGALRYVAVNDAYAQLVGRRREEFPGRQSRAFSSTLEDDDCLEKQRRALVFGSDEVASWRSRPDARSHAVRIERFLCDDDTAYLFGAFEEPVTEAPALEADPFATNHFNAKMLGTALDLLDAGVGIFSEDERLIYWNGELEKYFSSLGGTLQPNVTIRDLIEQVYDHRKHVDADVQLACSVRQQWIDERLKTLRVDHWQATEPLPDGRWLRSVNKRLDNGWLIMLRLDVTEYKIQEMHLGKNAEEAEIFRAAFEDLPVAVFLRDGQRRLTYANAAYETMLGESREKFIGMTDEEMFPLAAERFRTENEQILADGVAIVKAEDIPFLDGHSMAAITRLGRISSPAGEPYIVGSITDVTMMREAQKEAERLHAELIAILEALPVGLTILDRDMRIEYSNHALNEFWRLEGDPLRNWRGHTYHEFMRYNFDRGAYPGVSDFDAFYKERVEMWRKPGPFTPFELANIDGRRILVDRCLVPDDKILITCIDISTLRKHEQEVQSARAALDQHAAIMHDATSAMSQGLMILRDHRIVFANDAAAAILDVPRELLAIGSPSQDLLQYQAKRGDFGSESEAETELRRWQQMAKQHRACNASCVIEGRRWVDLECKVSGDETCLIVLTDVTEVKQRERDLQRLLERAESADRAKSEFLANMSHEIRTPMNGVLGMAELLAKSNLDTRQKTFTDIIVKSGNALLTIINDILDFSKIDAGQMTLRKAPFDPLDAIEDVATLLSSSAAEKDIELIVRGAANHHIVLGDAGRFRQVITNLIGNSIKFTERGHILVDVYSDLTEDGRVQLTVRIEDTGIGIPDDMIGSIFEKFSQVDGSSTRRHEGTGLGLAITSGLVQLFGGQIKVESQLDKGSIFTIEMSFALSAQRSPTESPAHSVRGARVLVIDDNAVNRRILTEQLALWGFDAVAVENGTEGLAVLRAAAAMDVTVDALILDYQMPVMNGLTVANIIRGDPALHDLPIIFLTSMDTASTEQAFEHLHIQAHLMKPARSHLLRTTVTDVVKAHRYKRREAPKTVAPEIPASPGLRPVSVFEVAPADTAMERADGRHLDVLVAEDNEVNQIVFTQILQATGFTFRIVENGAQAVEAWQDQNPDLILMDVSMPVMNGHQAARRIREIEADRGGHVPIIGVTAHALESDRDLCLAAGMDDYLSKPISPELLEAKIGEWRRPGVTGVSSRG
jgi:PAS domain S-box-containing protein